MLSTLAYYKVIATFCATRKSLSITSIVEGSFRLFLLNSANITKSIKPDDRNKWYHRGDIPIGS